jgi:hypothetical protein
MTGLRSVHWEKVPIPAAVLESLSKLPFPVQLHVFVREANHCDPAARQFLAALASCGVLASVTLDAAYLNAADGLNLSQPLKQLLLTCPDLVNLSVNLHLPKGGCVRYAPPFQYPGLGFGDGERPLRPLKSLTIHEYPWGEEEVHDRHTFHSQGYPGSGEEMNYWAASFDWSALHRFEDTSPCTQVRFAVTLAPMLTALREVRFTSTQDTRGNSIETFFDRVPSTLEAISVPSLDSIGVAAFARHAPSLRRLTVHQTEGRSASAWEEHLLSSEALTELAETAPHLEELGIDMLRAGGEWPHAQLDVLARFPSLRVLELWFGFGNWETWGPPQPALTASSAARLFTELRCANPNPRQLRVHSGCSLPSRIGFPVDLSSYLDDNRASFDCRIAERDDDAAAGELEFTSFYLSPRLNSRTQRILKGNEKREDIQGNLIEMQVALDGPMRHGECYQWKKKWPMPKLLALMDAAKGWNVNNSNTARSRLSRIWRRQRDTALLDEKRSNRLFCFAHLL